MDVITALGYWLQHVDPCPCFLGLAVFVAVGVFALKGE